ncbi:MAG TPA: RNA polymerase subunit sigma-24 [Planctomycetaceae bacterium]|nr:RNA polymerase subunit sigma-24 [Planctomycetaceae bacterium]
MIRQEDSQALLVRAKQGDAAALGDLLTATHPYLRVLAKSMLDRRLQGKAAAEDLIQEAFLEAHRDFQSFRGDKLPEFLAWLRRILSNRASKLIRRYLGTKARDVRLERNMLQDLDRSSLCLASIAVVTEETPSRQAIENEQTLALAKAIEKLPNHYRDVIEMHQLQSLELAEVAEIMNRTHESVRKLWARGLVKLRSILKEME